MAIKPMMNFGNKFGGAPQIRPCCNIGSFFDVLTGTLVKGKWGNVIINGGMWNTDGIVGPNNSFKSTLSKHKLLALMANYPYSTGLTLDTEISGTGPIRYNELAQNYPGLADYDFSSGDRWTFTTNAEMFGDIWWSNVKEYLREKVAKPNRKVNTLTTPMVNAEGEYVTGLIPTVIEIDSLSQLTAENVEGKYAELKASDGKRNMEDMAAAKAKSKIVRDMPTTLAHGGGYAILTAHVGEKKDLDPYNPSMSKFQAMKGNKTVKYIPEAFLYNMNNCYEIIVARPLLNQSTKAPEFPNKGQSFQGDTDLMELTINVLRGKGGSTAYVFPLICSQSEGLLTGLSDFWFIKKNKYGFTSDSSNLSYAIELYPECKLSRTTVRDKIDEDPKLRRALRLQADLLLAQFTHKACRLCPEERFCSPKELYNDLKALGYDWDELLDTQNEWSFREVEQEKPTLTIYDLLNMRAGVYTPYWQQDAWKKTKPKAMEP